MKYLGVAAVLSLLFHRLEALPQQFESLSIVAPGGRSNTTTHSLSGRDNCNIHAFPTDHCTGQAVRHLEYVGAAGICYLCAPFDNMHSIYVDPACSPFEFTACDVGCDRETWHNNCAGFGGHPYTQRFKPGRCYNINTGNNFVSGWPCF